MKLTPPPVFRGLPPGEAVVRAPAGHPVVADAHDPPLRVDDDGAHLGGGVLGTHGGEEGGRHEVLVPGEVALALPPRSGGRSSRCGCCWRRC